MNVTKMTWLVAQKEIRTVFRNKGLLFAGFYVSSMFGVMNMWLNESLFGINNVMFSAALLTAVFVGYSLSRFVFLREKQEKVIETLLCSPLSLKSIWLGKVIGATIPAYLFSLLTVSIVMIISMVMMRSFVLPSAAIFIHILGGVPVFTTAAISLLGFSQFHFGMRENKIMSYLIVLGLVPFIYPSMFRLLLGDENPVVSWREVGISAIFAVLLLALTIYLSRYLSKEKIVTTISSD